MCEVMFKITTVIVALMLVGCNEEYRQADDSILCDVATGKAFRVTAGVGATSFVKADAKYDKLCRTSMEPQK